MQCEERSKTGDGATGHPSRAGTCCEKSLVPKEPSAGEDDMSENKPYFSPWAPGVMKETVVF